MWLLTPKEGGPKPLVLGISQAGKARLLSERGPEIELLLKSGVAVALLDVRGCGETSPGKRNPHRGGYFGVDFTESFLALHLGRPLLGQRTYDVLALINHLQEQKAAPVGIVAVGMTGPVALHAGFLHHATGFVRLRRSLSSWSSVVRTPVSYNQLTNAVPGVLAVYDLTDLKVKGLHNDDPVDATGKPTKGR